MHVHGSEGKVDDISVRLQPN